MRLSGIILGSVALCKQTEDAYASNILVSVCLPGCSSVFLSSCLALSLSLSSFSSSPFVHLCVCQSVCLSVSVPLRPRRPPAFAVSPSLSVSHSLRLSYSSLCVSLYLCVFISVAGARSRCLSPSHFPTFSCFFLAILCCFHLWLWLRLSVMFCFSPSFSFSLPFHFHFSCPCSLSRFLHIHIYIYNYTHIHIYICMCTICTRI